MKFYQVEIEAHQMILHDLLLYEILKNEEENEGEVGVGTQLMMYLAIILVATAILLLFL